MIPEEVEHRIATYFFHNYLPDNIMMQVEEMLLLSCVRIKNEGDLDHDELVWTAIGMIQEQLEGKSLE